MNWRQAYNHWTNSRYSRVSTDAAFKAGFEAGQEAERPKAQEWTLEPDEHMPTLEGVIEYLETQNDTAFLAYRRLERGSEPGMDRQVRERLSAFAYEVWQGTGDARNLAQEKAKPVLVPSNRLDHAGDPLPHPMPDGETIEEWTARKQADERVKQQAAALEDPSAR